MDIEFEAQFPNIDTNAVRKKLQELGAACLSPERLMKRKNYDFSDASLYAKGAWVRLRDEGDKVTLIYKQLEDRTITGTKEVMVVVDDWDATDKFLHTVGLIEKTYQETKRESWLLDGVEVEIDTWPWVPTFFEIEGKSENEVKSIAQKLGFEWSEAMFGSVENIYQMNYDVSEVEIDSWKEILFIDTPEWLLAKKK